MSETTLMRRDGNVMFVCIFVTYLLIPPTQGTFVFVHRRPKSGVRDRPIGVRSSKESFLSYYIIRDSKIYKTKSTKNFLWTRRTSKDLSVKKKNF